MSRPSGGMALAAVILAAFLPACFVRKGRAVEGPTSLDDSLSGRLLSF